MLTDETTRYFIVIEAIMVVITLLFGLYSYVMQQAAGAAREDLGRSCCEERQMRYFVARRPWYFRSGAATRIPEVPTVDNLIRNGDRLLFSSALFDHIDSSPQDVSWVSLYTQFFREMSWLDPVQTRAARGNKDIFMYMQESDKRKNELLQVELVRSRKSEKGAKERQGDEEGGHRGETITNNILRKPRSDKPVRHCLFPGVLKGPPMLVCCVLPLELPTSKQDKTLDLPDIRPLWIIDRKPCIEMSREELAGLALALGISLIKHKDESMSGTGPFGVHLNLVRDVTHWRLRLTHQHRQMDHEEQLGSGYSILFAKCIACGCLPLDVEKPGYHSEDYGDGEYERERERKRMATVRCIHISPDFVHWICNESFAKRVKHLKESRKELDIEAGKQQKVVRMPQDDDKRKSDMLPLIEASETCHGLKYLHRLPNAYRIDAYCYYPSTDIDPPSSDSRNSGSERMIESKDDEINEDQPSNSDTKEGDKEELNLNKLISEEERSGFTLKWFRAVARIAFGGLVPQAGKYLINAVLFTVLSQTRKECDRSRQHFALSCHGSPGSPEEFPQSPIASPRRLAWALQRLTDELHKDCHHFELFGDYVHQRTRCWSQQSELETDFSIPATPRHAGALFHRYTTALERLVAISLQQQQQEAANEASRNTTSREPKPDSTRRRDNRTDELLEAMGRGVAAFTTAPNPFQAADTHVYVQKVYEKCVELLFINFSAKESDASDLVARVNIVRFKIRAIRKRMRMGKKFPLVVGPRRAWYIDVEDCANVARCIIAVWALRVPLIELEWEASGRLQNPAFNELPSVMAFE
jgi:hypothetical protein